MTKLINCFLERNLKIKATPIACLMVSGYFFEILKTRIMLKMQEIMEFEGKVLQGNWE